jgi:hypothetical protein
VCVCVLLPKCMNTLDLIPKFHQMKQRLHITRCKGPSSHDVNHPHIISDDPNFHVCSRASRPCHGLNVGHWSDLSDRPWTCEQLYVCLIHGALGFGHCWELYQFPVYYCPLGCCFCSYGWLCVLWSAGCFVSGGGRLGCLPLLTSAELALLGFLFSTSAELALLEVLSLRRLSPAAGSIRGLIRLLDCREDWSCQRQRNHGLGHI